MGRVLLVILGAALAVFPRAAGAETPFYQGKQLTLLINFAPGGPTDIEGRLLAKHIADHIDGHPTVIVENKDGASGLVGATYLGEVGPNDGTMFGYLTGTSWNYFIAPQKFHVDFRNYTFIGYQPGNAVYYVRSDVPPGIKTAADIMRAKGLVVGGLGADSSKDLLMRLSLDMLGVKYHYVTGYRSSNTARLALENGEINMHAESTPSYFGVVEPSLVKSGRVTPLWYDPTYDGKTFSSPDVTAHSGLASFPEFYQKVKGVAPGGPLWDAYRTNLSVDAQMLRLVVMPPGAPPAAVAALRKALLALNHDKAYAAEAMTAIQFVPHYTADADVEARLRQRLTVAPAMRRYILDYMTKAQH